MLINVGVASRDETYTLLWCELKPCAFLLGLGVCCESEYAGIGDIVHPPTNRKQEMMDRAQIMNFLETCFTSNLWQIPSKLIYGCVYPPFLKIAWVTEIGGNILFLFQRRDNRDQYIFVNTLIVEGEPKTNFGFEEFTSILCGLNQ